MGSDQIKVGVSYRGRSVIPRKVLKISREIVPCWYYTTPRPDGPGVEYEQNGVVDTCYLCRFAKWAKEIV